MFFASMWSVRKFDVHPHGRGSDFDERFLGITCASGLRIPGSLVLRLPRVGFSWSLQQDEEVLTRFTEAAIVMKGSEVGASISVPEEINAVAC
jgi:hypothetical protein